MEATALQFEEDLPGQAPAINCQEAQREDAYWHRTYWQERYYRVEFEYEDYAPAYCVGYVGCVQYGGDFGDAERSLWANWERIRGDSRLAPEDALPAMLAAWQRMARLRRQPRLTLIEGGQTRPPAPRPTPQLALRSVVNGAAAAAP